MVIAADRWSPVLWVEDIADVLGGRDEPLECSCPTDWVCLPTPAFEPCSGADTHCSSWEPAEMPACAWPSLGAGCSLSSGAALGVRAARLPGEGSLAGTSANGVWTGTAPAFAEPWPSGASLAGCSMLGAFAALPLSKLDLTHLPSARCTHVA